MAQKTIPELNESIKIAAGALAVVDTGVVTNRITAANLGANLRVHNSEYIAVVGEAADFTSGKASHSSPNAAIATVTGPGKILLLGNRSWTEDIVVDVPGVILEFEPGAEVDGLITFSTGATGSAALGSWSQLDNIVIDVGVLGIEVSRPTFATGKTFLDSNLQGNILRAWQIY